MSYGYNSWLSALLFRVMWWLDTNVSEKHTVSIFRVEGPEDEGTTGPPKCWCPTTTLHGTTNQKTTKFIFTAMKT
jgi:hypothetical protein